MSFLAIMSQVLLALLGMFLMLIVLLQRGRGGGLAGAFGGLGGQSAFGTKAGDVFTRITVVVAILWVIVAGGSGFFLRAAAESGKRSADLPAQGAPAAPDEAVPPGVLDEDDAPITPAPDVNGAVEEEPAADETPAGDDGETADPQPGGPLLGPANNAAPDADAPAGPDADAEPPTLETAPQPAPAAPEEEPSQP